MNGIHFVSPTSAKGPQGDFEQVREEVVGPPVYASRNPLSDHLWAAIWHPVTELTVRRHVNRKMDWEFECFSYYCDDPYVAAYCAAHDHSYLVTVGIQFVSTLVKVCHLLAPALERRPRNPKRDTPTGPALERDPVLASLIEGKDQVLEAEALEIVAAWPSAQTQGAQIELGEYALFYDLIRLVWVHEWAHALCGHVGFTSQKLGIARLHEFSADRVGDERVAALPYPKYEVLQALEIHADEFATRYCVGQLLWGYDPIGQLAGPQVDLVDRLLFFNLACCVFAVIWSRAEQRYAPGISYYPPLAPLTSDEPDPLYVPFTTSHPPAALRYLRFRDFERELATQYALRHAPALSSLVDALSTGMLDTLTSVNQHFYDLYHQTPLLVTTPTMKRLYAYEKHLLDIGLAVEPYITAYGYVPTYDPARDDHE